MKIDKSIVALPILQLSRRSVARLWLSGAVAPPALGEAMAVAAMAAMVPTLEPCRVSILDDLNEDIRYYYYIYIEIHTYIHIYSYDHIWG